MYFILRTKNVCFDLLAELLLLILDELVEMEVTKPQSCGKDNTEDVVTTVIFQCESDSKNVSSSCHFPLSHMFRSTGV